MSNAQTNNNDLIVTVTPDEGLIPCGVVNTSETVHLAATNNLTNIQITFDLPEGIEYVAGSLIGGTENDISNLNIPIFDLGDLNNLESLDFSFARTAFCDAVQFANDGGVLKDEYSIAYQGGTESPLVDDDPLLSTYSISSSTLVISQIETETVNLSDHINREIAINQGGTGCLQSFVHYVVIDSNVVNNFYMEYEGTVLSPNAQSTIDTLYYDIDLSAFPFDNVGNGNDCLENGETIFLHENFDVVGCLQQATKHHAYWGCFPGDHCQDATPQTGTLLFGAEAPDISIDLTENSTYGLDFCNAKTFQFVITNNNLAVGGAALDLLVNIGLGHNNSSLTQHDYNPFWHYANLPGDNSSWNTRYVSNFKINGVLTNDTIHWSSSEYGADDMSVVMIKDLFTTDPDSAGVGLEDLDNDGYFDDLPPGESFTFSYDVSLENISEHCNSNGYSQYLGWEHCYTDVSFLDQCDNQRPGQRKDVSYQNMISQYQVTNEFTAPTDVYDGVNFEVAIIPKFYATPYCGNGDKKIRVSIDLPEGVFWTGDEASFNEDNGTADVADTIYMNGSILVYEIDRVNSYTEEFTFPLNIDCDFYDDLTLILPVVCTYICGDDCFQRDFYCDNFPIITTHCPGSCVGPSPYGMDAHRITAGWTDNTMSALVDLSTLPEEELDSYLTRDTMQVDTYTLVHDTTLSNLWVDIYYNSTIDSTEVLAFLSASYTTYDYSTGQTTSGEITVDPILLASDTTSDYVYRFDISQSIPASQLYEDSDSITFTALFKVKDNIEEGFQKVFPIFRFRPFSVLNGGEERSCNSWGDQVKVLKPKSFLNSWFSTGTQLFLCQENPMYAGTLRVWDNVTDQCPSEYRPPIFFDSYTVHLPLEIEFTGNVSYQGYTGALGDSLGDLLVNFNEFTNDVTFWPNPNGNFRDLDQGGHQARQFSISVVASCNVVDDENIPFTVDANFRNYAYSNETEALNYEFLSNSYYYFEYTSPSFIMQSPVIFNDGTASVASWDIEIANTSNGTVPYNWVRIEEVEGINITDIIDLDTDSTLNYVSQDGYTYAEIGLIETGGTNLTNIRIVTELTDCVTDMFNVALGWNCNGYPDDYSDDDGVLCYDYSIDLGIEPLSAGIEFEVLSNVDLPVTMCEPFDVEMAIYSVDAADVINPFITFLIPGGADGLIILNDSVSVEYPFDSGNFENVSVDYDGPQVTINLMENSAIEAQNGIAGIANDGSIEGRKVRIIVSAQTECEFIANSVIKFNAYGIEPCGGPASGNGVVAYSQPIAIDGVEVDYEFINTVITPEGGAEGCGDMDTIYFESYLFSGVNGQTTDDDYGVIELPYGVNFEGTFECTSDQANCPTLISSSMNWSGNQEIEFNIPSGITNGTELQYYIIVDSGNEGCSLSEITLSTRSKVYDVACGELNCEFVIIQTGYGEGSYHVSKPMLSVNKTDNTSEMIVNNNIGEFQVEFEVANIASLPVESGYTYDVYCASSNGQSIGESLFSGILETEIPVDSTLLVNVSFESPNFCDASNGLVIEFVPSENNCQCAPIWKKIPLNGQNLQDVDADFDGVEDEYDDDIDNDGLTNAQEDENLDGDNDFTTNPTDSDNDEIPNYKDLDSDNDGIPDIIEAGGMDDDGDGRVPVNADGTLTFDFENDGLTDEFIVDSNGDGEADQAVDLSIAGASPLSNPDTDLDGLADVYDLDSDGDGIADIIEVNGIDSDQDGHLDYLAQGNPLTMADDDHDGFSNLVDTDNNSVTGVQDGGVKLVIPDTDQDGIPNYLDIDSDDDGIVDNIEGMPTLEYVSPDDYDADHDGIDDAYDGDDQRIEGIGNGEGMAVVPTNTDMDDDPDYVDLDADNDTFLDAEEGWDLDNDGLADTAPFGVDTDHDGLDNAYDQVVRVEDAANNASNEMTPNDFPDLDSPDNDLDWREAIVSEVEFNVLDGFSPNGDGANDVLQIFGLENFEYHQVTIFNRWGNVVWKTSDYPNNPWDGTSMYGITIGGNVLPAGTYFYQVDLGEDNDKVDENELQGFIYLNK